MVYNYISGLAIIEKVNDDYNIQSADWIPLAPKWIFEGLRLIKARSTTVLAPPMNIPVNDYRFDLPDDVASIERVCDEKNVPILISSSIIALDHGITKSAAKELKRCIISLQYAEINSDDSFVTIHYRKYPTHRSSELQQNIPVIPDDETTILALTDYVLFKILVRGYVHPYYRLGAQNPMYDPQLNWIKNKVLAKRSLSKLTDHDLEQITRDFNDMFTDKYHYYTKGFTQ